MFNHSTPRWKATAHHSDVRFANITLQSHDSKRELQEVPLKAMDIRSVVSMLVQNSILKPLLLQSHRISVQQFIQFFHNVNRG
jgi:hypothetical protein